LTDHHIKIVICSHRGLVGTRNVRLRTVADRWVAVSRWLHAGLSAGRRHGGFEATEVQEGLDEERSDRRGHVVNERVADL